MNKPTHTTQKQVRAAFWEAHPHFDEQCRAAGIRSKRQNEHFATLRCTFIDLVENLRRDGEISAALADRVTL